MNLVKGVKYSLVTAIFSGLAVFFNRFVVKAVGDPLVFTTLKNLGVGVVMIVWLSRRSFKGEIKWRDISKSDWVKLVVIGVVGGSLPFYLFFKGLVIASSAKAALIHKLLVFFVAVWAVPVLKEKVSLKQAGALVLILGSNFVIGGLGEWSWGRGETMILGATILWAIENVVAKTALKKVQVDVLVGARMILGSLILLGATLISGKFGLIFKLSASQWGMTLVTVLMLTGYVASWYKALKVAPVTLVATVLTLASVITNVLSSLFVTHKLTIGLLYQTILLVAGVWFFVIKVGKDERNLAVR